MQSADLFIMDHLFSSLSACLQAPIDPLLVNQVSNLSPEISSSRIFRVTLDKERARQKGYPASLILKIPDWDAQTLIQINDPMVGKRELSFIESDLAANLPLGLAIPRLLRVDIYDTTTWLWMEDVASAVDIQWTPERVLQAAEANVLLHTLYEAEEANIERYPWLQREEYALYVHHIPAAHQHLEHIRAHPYWSTLFQADEITDLHRCLDQWEWGIQQLRALPLTLIHGDFHIRNLGFTSTNELMLLDWAQIGLAPLGCDIATLISLYEPFGGNSAGRGLALEDDIFAAYCDAVARLTGNDRTRPDIIQACGLWHLTWGLHLRLGPGLAYLLQKDNISPESKRGAATDIYRGSQRARAFLAAQR